MSRLPSPDAIELHTDQVRRLKAVTPGLFCDIKDHGQTKFALLNDGPINVSVNKPVYLRPDKLSPDVLTLDLLTVVPLYQDRVNIGWAVQIPELPTTWGEHYVCVRRKGAVAAERDRPQIRLSLKSLVALSVPDVSTILLSTQIKDVKL